MNKTVKSILASIQWNNWKIDRTGELSKSFGFKCSLSAAADTGGSKSFTARLYMVKVYSDPYSGLTTEVLAKSDPFTINVGYNFSWV